MKLLRNILFVLFLLTQAGTVFLQKKINDTVYLKQKDELSKQAHKYYYKDFNKAISILHEQRQLMEKYQDTVGLINLDNKFLWLYTTTKVDIDSADVYTKKLENNLNIIKQDALLAKTYTRIGLAYQVKGYYRNAMKNYLASLEYKERIKDVGSLGFSYNLIGKVYELQNQYKNSLQFHRKAIKERKKLKTDWHLAHSYNNIGITLRKSGSLDSALYYTNKALEIRTKNLKSIISKRRYAVTLKNRGEIYVAKKEFNKAIDDFKESIAINDKYNAEYTQLQSLNGIAKACIQLKKYNDANHYFKQSKNILKNNSFKDLEVNYLNLKAQYYFEIGEYKKAYLIEKKHDSLSQIIRGENILKNTEELQKMYSAEKRDKIIAKLNLANTISENEIKNQKLNKKVFLVILVALFIVLTGLIVFFINKYKQTKLLTQKNALITKSLNEKEVLLKEVHHRVRNNFQIVSSLLYLQSQSIHNEKASLALSEAQERIKSMALLHQKLYQNDNNLMNISAEEYIKDLVDGILQSYNKTDDIKVDYQIDDILIGIDTMISIGLIINELITNIIKHAYTDYTESKTIIIALKYEKDYLSLLVKDNGIGFKGEKPNSFGLKLVDILSKKLKADLSIINNEGTEVKFIMTLSHKVCKLKKEGLDFLLNPDPIFK